MSKSASPTVVAAKIEASLAASKVQLTLGGEPTYVPIQPDGPEWYITALGPTKLRYAYALADALIAQSLPGAVIFFSPGKFYPGEGNPRWALNLVWNTDRKPLVPALAKPSPVKLASPDDIDTFKAALLEGLKLKASWLRAADPLIARRAAWVLPLDHDRKVFRSDNWTLGKRIELLRTEGPAGLRLPLNLLPDNVSKRALTIEVRDGQFHVFLPPLLQKPFLTLLEKIVSAQYKSGIGPVVFSGYVPGDETDRWGKLGIAADPGVIEVNLPPCYSWAEYDGWMHKLEKACEPAGLRSFKQTYDGETLGTGGGNHILFGGPTLDTNPLFTHPRWVTSILRYWQHHPCLSYLFTGQYVGASSQAPRPDESSSALYDLEMAYQFLETLPPGDHRYLISETIRHLHTDGSGNTHRSEASFDKFWNTSFDGGCRGLLEFRAVETLPHASWMSAVALLWRALAAWLLKHPFTKPLVAHGEKLHDFYFLPTCLWSDFEAILRDLKKGGFELPVDAYRAIADWRFPTMLKYSSGAASLTIRKALEDWPLLCETPLEGGSTSRFVDTSIDRLEFVASKTFVDSHEIRVQGRKLTLDPFPNGRLGAGLRYRRTALHPSLHPGISPQMPLALYLKSKSATSHYRLDAGRRIFEPAESDTAHPHHRHPCKTLHGGLLTRDLRLP